MKLHFMSLLAAAALIVSCSTTRTSTSEDAAYASLPTSVKLDFERHYPDATNVTWTQYDATAVPIDWELTDWAAMEPSDYVVRFDMGSNNYYAFYDANGTWVGSAYAMSNTALLPSAVTNTLNAQFKGYTVDAVQKETWKDKTAYELKLVNGESRVKVLIDASGNVLKQKDKY